MHTPPKACIACPEVISVSYRILYDRSIDKYEVYKTPSHSYKLCILSGAVLFLLSARVLMPDIWSAFISLLIPGEDSVTAAAFHTMTGDLLSGADVYNALLDFCRMIIHGA